MKHKLMQLFLLTVFAISACSSFYGGPLCDQPERNFADNSSIRLLWSKSNMLVPNVGSLPMIRGLSDNVFVVTAPRNGVSLINAIDSQTGDVLWQQPQKLGISILTSDKSLYVGENNRITQYDPKTGNQIDQIVSPIDVGLIDPIYFAENKVFAFAPGSGRSLTYDINTKEIKLSDPLLLYTPLVVEDGVLYLTSFDGFEARDVNTQRSLWKSPIDGQVINPLFADDVIIIPTTSNIYILNRNIGALIAKLDAHVISNVTQDETHIYFLTKEGTLGVVDKKSGQEIQKIILSPTPFALSTPQKNVGVYAIWINPQNQVIVAAFGDSCQLVGLEIQTP
jgi:outer membrane protein assembly factor BamB